jgi:hypothetical protein
LKPAKLQQARRGRLRLNRTRVGLEDNQYTLGRFSRSSLIFCLAALEDNQYALVRLSSFNRTSVGLKNWIVVSSRNFLKSF